MIRCFKGRDQGTKNKENYIGSDAKKYIFLKFGFSELAVVVNEVLEHHPIQTRMRQRDRHTDPAGSSIGQGSHFWPGTGL